ncbi:ParA family protein [Dactylosporangium sp. NPDC005572]|uniref:ParA family protein n=1 Tax=Dactylosporangium sp. NPDC005572 TaxID=3156889 RepID=UPI0033B9BD84
MKVVAVANNKGGVGKTTVTANLGAGLANLGMRVLLIDLDPQASLTKSFFTVDETARFLTQVRTIGTWFKSSDRGRAKCLAELVVSPPRFNGMLKHGGWLELIPSDSTLVDAEVLIPNSVDATGNIQDSKFLRMHRRLAEDLGDPAFAKYDVILIDCPPAFSLTTKMAIVASDIMLIPARPDFLSAEGIQELGKALTRLTSDYNQHLSGSRSAKTLAPMRMPRTAVVFTMVQLFSGRPIDVHSQFINEVKALGVPVLDTMIRDRSSAFAASGRHGVPTIMAHGVPSEVRNDLGDVIDELRKQLERLPS